jgi:hypothetical protein
MSYSFEGKVVNQSTMSGSKPSCSKCKKLVAPPNILMLSNPGQPHGTTTYLVYHYLGTSQFIYETKSGRAVVYCSEYCRNKHNHRFAKG